MEPYLLKEINYNHRQDLLRQFGFRHLKVSLFTPPPPLSILVNLFLRQLVFR